MKYFARIVLSMLVISIFFIPIQNVLAQSSSGQTVSEVEKLISKPVTQIRIPGLNKFSDPIVEQDSGLTHISLPFLGEYISAIYKWMVAAAGVISVIVIIVSGLMWTMSGGSSGVIDAAKKRISGAVVGLLLAVGSYTVLYTINPELVTFKNVRVLYVSTQDIGSVDFGEYANEAVLTGSATTPTFDLATLPTNTVPYFYQCADNSPSSQKKFPGQNWGGVIYGTVIKDGKKKAATICDIGCGLVSISMILSHYRSEVVPQPLELSIGKFAPPPPASPDPHSLANWIVKNDIKKARFSEGTGLATLQRIAKAYGFQYKGHVSFKKAQQLLIAKRPLIGYVQNPIRKQEEHKPRKDRDTDCKFTKGGHYITVTGYDPAQKAYTMHDPGTKHSKYLDRETAGEQYLHKDCKVQFIYVGKDPI